MTDPAKRRRYLPLIISLLIVLVSLIYYLSYYKSFKIDVDEGLLINGAMRVLSGQLPLKDFHQYMPGRFYLLGLWFLIFGKSVMVERLLFVLIHTAKNLLMYHTARKVIPAPFSFIPVVLTLLLPGFWAKGFVGLSLLLCAFFLLRYMENPENRRLVVLGLVVGISVYFREDYAGYAAIATGLMLLYLGVSARDRFTRIIARGLTFSAAIFTALTPMLLLYGIRGGFPALVDGIHQTVKLGHVESMVFLSPKVFLKWPPDILSRDLGLIFPYLTMLLFLGTGLMLFIRWRRGRGLTELRDRLLLATLALAVPAYLHIWHWTHEFRTPQSGAMIHLLWAYLIYLSFIRLRDRSRNKSGLRAVRAVSWSALFLISLGIQVFFAVYCFASHPMVRYDGGSIVLRKGPHGPISHTERSGIEPPLRQAVVYSRILEYIDDFTSPEDTLLCFGESPLYFLSGRRNATEFDNGRIPSYFPKKRKRLIPQIQANPPELVIIRDWEYGFWYPKMPEVFDEITSTYFHSRNIYDFYIFTRVSQLNDSIRRGNTLLWNGKMAKATSQYLKAHRQDPKNPDARMILNRLFSSDTRGPRTLPALDGYYLHKMKDRWRLSWGSQDTRRFSGEIRLAGGEDLSSVITSAQTWPESAEGLRFTKEKNHIRFDSETAESAQGIELVFAESHAPLRLIFDLERDGVAAERIFISGKGMERKRTAPYTIVKEKR